MTRVSTITRLDLNSVDLMETNYSVLTSCYILHKSLEHFIWDILTYTLNYGTTKHYNFPCWGKIDLNRSSDCHCPSHWVTGPVVRIQLHSLSLALADCETVPDFRFCCPFYKVFSQGNRAWLGWVAGPASGSSTSLASIFVRVTLTTL